MNDGFRAKITREERGGRALAALAAALALLALAHVGAEDLSAEAEGSVRARGAPAALAPGAASPGAAALRDGERLDVNTATAAELTLLPGIGPAIAGRIVAHREAQGPYRTVEGLEAVRGVGPRIRARIEPLVTVDRRPE